MSNTITTWHYQVIKSTRDDKGALTNFVEVPELCGAVDAANRSDAEFVARSRVLGASGLVLSGEDAATAEALCAHNAEFTIRVTEATPTCG